MIVNILIVDDEKTFAEILSENFLRSGENASAVYNAEDALKYLMKNDVDVVILDINMKEMDGVTTLAEVKRINPDIEVIMLTGYGTVKTARDTLKLGAFDFLAKPCDLDELSNTVRHAYERKSLKKENRSLHAVVEKIEHIERKTRFIGDSRQIIEMLSLVDNIAPTDCSVLIQGESGTGKELIARLIHEKSRRSNNGFIAINCGAIPENLMESEFFGYERGAFTGAVARKIGIFEAFDGGTVLLDEIGDLPLHMQVKLLRVLESHEFQRLGSTKTQRTDVRIISASNKDLEKETDKGNFRKDLFYRLNVITISIPALEERKSDIELLANYFLNKFSSRFKKKIKSFSPRAMELLKNYPWPGNVRELENVIERSVILCTGETIDEKNLPGNLTHPAKKSPVLTNIDAAGRMEDVEREHIRLLLTEFHHHRAKTARALGISERTLYRKLKQYGLLEK